MTVRPCRGKTSAMDSIALVPATLVSLLVVLPLVGLSLELLAVPHRYELAVIIA